jgi:hypothetical protein
VINLRSLLEINRPMMNLRSPLGINQPVMSLRVMNLRSPQETNLHSRRMINHRKATPQTRLSLVVSNPRSLRMINPSVISQQKETNRKFPIKQQP